jgi:hypothetical protein
MIQIAAVSVPSRAEAFLGQFDSPSTKAAKLAANWRQDSLNSTVLKNPDVENWVRIR